MSLFGNIIGTISKIANTAYGIIKIALPILKGLRPAVDEIDQAFDFIEEGIASGGIAADDFLDRNLDAIVSLENVSARGTVVMQQINEIATKLRIYSQEESPDTITEEEAITLGNDLLELRVLISNWKPELVAAEKSLENLNE